MALTLTAKNVSASREHGAVLRNYKTGAAIDVGEAVYVDSNGELQLADANGASEDVARAKGVVVALTNQYGETTGASGDYATVCLFGPVYGWTDMTPNGNVYVGTTPGELTQTAPTPNAYQFVIGYAVAADVLFISPESDAATSV